MEKKIFYESNNLKICGLLNINDSNKTIIVICHARTSQKNATVPLNVAQELNKHKINNFRFDGVSCGESEGDYKDYTGIVFRGYTYGTGDAVVKGGRYNALLRQFGKDAPAIGFAFVVDELMNAIHRQNIPVQIEETEMIILYQRACQQQAIELGCQMRHDGKKVELIRKSDRKRLEDYQAYAEGEHFQRLIYIQEDGVQEISLRCNQDRG